MEKIPGLVPIRNFAIVDENKRLYRSAQPMYRYEYEWLRNKLGLSHIVNLRSESSHDNMFAPANGIEVKTIAVPDHKVPTVEQAQDFIEFVQNNENILFHCEHGHGRTSTFCVLARIATGWTLEDAIKEELEVFGYEFKHPAQLEFLQSNFSTVNAN